MNKTEKTKSEDYTIQKKEWELPTLTLFDMKMTYASVGSGSDGSITNPRTVIF